MTHLDEMRYFIESTYLDESIGQQLEEDITPTVDQLFEQTEYDELMEDLQKILFKMRAYQSTESDNMAALHEESGVNTAADMLERVINKHLEK